MKEYFGYDMERLAFYENEKIAHPGAEYDFTYDHRYLVYHFYALAEAVFVAVDKTTSLSEEITRLVCDEVTDLERDEVHAMMARIHPARLRSVETAEHHEKQSLELIDRFFRSDLPNAGYAVREEQIKLCKKMFLGLIGKKASICEAEVGTGKTLAYLVAAFLAQRYDELQGKPHQPVTVSTSSIELQRVLCSKEIPALSDLLMNAGLIQKPLTSVLRKGKDHYFCRRRFRKYLNDLHLEPGKLEETIHYCDSNPLEEKVLDLDRVKIPASVKRKICVQGGCDGCCYRSACKYRRFMAYSLRGSQHIDFQIANHNLYLQSCSRAGILRSSKYVVIDEAHKLEEAAQTVYGSRISRRELMRYLRSVYQDGCSEELASSWKRLLSAAKRMVNGVFDSLQGVIAECDESTGTVPVALSGDDTHELRLLMETIGNLENYRNAKETAISGTAKHLILRLFRFLDCGRINVWAEMDDTGDITLCCASKTAAYDLYNDVWHSFRHHVLTSGTMSDGRDFRYFERQLGIDLIHPDRVSEMSVQSPFNYADHARLYIADDLPNPNGDEKEYLDAVSERIVELVKATNGHTAILFTSYRVLKAAYERTKDRLAKYELICMTRNDRNAIRTFQASENAVLFASGCMWEGVNCVGDCLSSVIIVRLPFPFRSAAMENRIRACGTTMSFVKKFVVPQMLIKLRQGAGRLIRTESDTGVISILDSRAASGLYADRVRHALIQFPTVDSPAEIRKFFKQVKDKKYFRS